MLAVLGSQFVCQMSRKKRDVVFSERAKLGEYFSVGRVHLWGMVGYVPITVSLPCKILLTVLWATPSLQFSLPGQWRNVYHLNTLLWRRWEDSLKTLNLVSKEDTIMPPCVTMLDHSQASRQGRQSPLSGRQLWHIRLEIIYIYIYICSPTPVGLCSLARK